jgi:hypothetical protein
MNYPPIMYATHMTNENANCYPNEIGDILSHVQPIICAASLSPTAQGLRSPYPRAKALVLQQSLSHSPSCDRNRRLGISINLSDSPTRHTSPSITNQYYSDFNTRATVSPASSSSSYWRDSPTPSLTWSPRRNMSDSLDFDEMFDDSPITPSIESPSPLSANTYLHESRTSQLQSISPQPTSKTSFRCTTPQPRPTFAPKASFRCTPPQPRPTFAPKASFRCLSPQQQKIGINSRKFSHGTITAVIPKLSDRNENPAIYNSSDLYKSQNEFHNRAMSDDLIYESSQLDLPMKALASPPILARSISDNIKCDSGNELILKSLQKYSSFDKAKSKQLEYVNYARPILNNNDLDEIIKQTVFENIAPPSPKTILRMIPRPITPLLDKKIIHPTYNSDNEVPQKTVTTCITNRLQYYNNDILDRYSPSRIRECSSHFESAIFASPCSLNGNAHSDFQGEAHIGNMG